MSTRDPLWDPRPRDLIVDNRGCYWLRLEHDRWLCFYNDGSARATLLERPSEFLSRAATPDEIKAFNERFMPRAAGKFEGVAVGEWKRVGGGEFLRTTEGVPIADINIEGDWHVYKGEQDSIQSGNAGSLEAARGAAIAVLRAEGAKV